ncbi:hypothetical protein AB205_0021990, partial [Aquarana catesbeiana]
HTFTIIHSSLRHPTVPMPTLVGACFRLCGAPRSGSRLGEAWMACGVPPLHHQCTESQYYTCFLLTSGMEATKRVEPPFAVF